MLFAAKTDAFCTKTQETLKWGCKFTLTDRRIVVDGGDKVWTINIPDDIARFRIVEEGHGLMKMLYAVIDLEKKAENVGGKVTPNGYAVYFKKKDMLKLEAITDKLFVPNEIFE